MNPHDLLKTAWTRAGYPTPGGPLVPMLQRVAQAVYEAFQRGEEDFVQAGWKATTEDFPFVPSHPRYQAMLDAYRELARPH